MTGEFGNKIKNLLDSVPPGALVDSKWMRRHEVADSLYHDYVMRGWLARLAHGLFIRPESNYAPEKPLEWQVVAASMHKIMEVNFHVGGITALTLQGYGHYVPMGDSERVEFYGDNLPTWLSKINTTGSIETNRLTLFSDSSLGVESIKNKGFGFGEEASFPVAAPERAVLEAIDQLPNGIGFDHLDKIFENLTSLSPRKLNRLLKACRKVKVLRLFFVFADRHEHAWLKHLDKETFNFGKGDRQLVKGGKTHPTYRITVPPKFAEAPKGGDYA